MLLSSLEAPSAPDTAPVSTLNKYLQNGKKGNINHDSETPSFDLLSAMMDEV